MPLRLRESNFAAWDRERPPWPSVFAEGVKVIKSKGEWACAVFCGGICPHSLQPGLPHSHPCLLVVCLFVCLLSCLLACLLCFPVCCSLFVLSVFLFVQYRLLLLLMMRFFYYFVVVVCGGGGGGGWLSVVVVVVVVVVDGVYVFLLLWLLLLLVVGCGCCCWLFVVC